MTLNDALTVQMGHYLVSPTSLLYNGMPIILTQKPYLVVKVEILQYPLNSRDEDSPTLCNIWVEIENEYGNPYPIYLNDCNGWTLLTTKEEAKLWEILYANH